jgi:hypothetical protein
LAVLLVDAFIRPTARRIFGALAAVIVVIAMGMFAAVIIPALINIEHIFRLSRNDPQDAQSLDDNSGC